MRNIVIHNKQPMNYLQYSEFPKNDHELVVIQNSNLASQHMTRFVDRALILCRTINRDHNHYVYFYKLLQEIPNQMIMLRRLIHIFSDDRNNYF